MQRARVCVRTVLADGVVLAPGGASDYLMRTTTAQARHTHTHEGGHRPQRAGGSRKMPASLHVSRHTPQTLGIQKTHAAWQAREEAHNKE